MRARALVDRRTDNKERCHQVCSSRVFPSFYFNSIFIIIISILLCWMSERGAVPRSCTNLCLFFFFGLLKNGAQPFSFSCPNNTHTRPTVFFSSLGFVVVVFVFFEWKDLLNPAAWFLSMLVIPSSLCPLFGREREFRHCKKGRI